MKQKSIMLIAILLLVSSFAMAAESSVLKTTLLRYEPVPAQPGNYITVYVQIENIGGLNADRVSIKLKDSFPFSVDDENEREKIIGVLKTSQTFVTDFKIRVDDRAISGSNELQFEVTDDYRTNEYQEKKFSITIQSRDANLNFESVKVNPAELSPGQRATVDITLSNDADINLNSINLGLKLFVSQGTTVVDLPFAIENGIGEKNIDVLISGEQTTFTYNLIAYPDVAPGIYKIPVTLSYFDNTGTEFTKADFITLIVNPKPDIEIFIEESDLNKDVMVGDVTIKVVNKAFGDLQFANLKLLPDESYELISSYDSAYLGSVDSDDYESQDFRVKAKQGVVNIPITLEYKDSLSNDQVLEKNLTLTLVSASDLGTQQKSSKTGLFVLIIVIAGGIWYYYKKKHKKK